MILRAVRSTSAAVTPGLLASMAASCALKRYHRFPFVCHLYPHNATVLVISEQ